MELVCLDRYVENLKYATDNNTELKGLYVNPKNITSITKTVIGYKIVDVIVGLDLQTFYTFRFKNKDATENDKEAELLIARLKGETD